MDIVADYRMALLHVDPPRVPPFQRSVQWYINVLTDHPILQLQIYAANHLGTTTALFLQLDQVYEEVEVRQNPQIRLTEMDKDRNV